jgi:predicted ribosomally synthesized peptide with SipW-like signal peptide
MAFNINYRSSKELLRGVCVTQNPFAFIAWSRTTLALILIAGVLSLTGGLGTMAYYTTTANSTANTFVAGSIHLHLTDNNETGLDAVTGSVVANVASNQWRPGQKVTAPITVLNTGDLGLTYGLSYTAADSGTTPSGGSSTPTQFLKLSIKSGGVFGDCNNTNFASWGTSVISGQTLAVGTSTLWADTIRSIGAASNEVLCFQVEFTKSETGGVENAAMGGTSTISFDFSGRQLP